MKKYLLILLMITTPLIGQETRRIFYKRPVFGLNLDIGYSYNLLSHSGFNVNVSPEFYIGTKHKVYFYLQLALGYQYSHYQGSDQIFFIFAPTTSGLNFSFYIGLGGYIREANEYDPWSIIMNGAVGGSLLFGKQDYNRSFTSLGGEGILAYLDLLFRKHMNDDYAFQFGPALIVNFLIPSITIDIIFKLGLAF